MQLIADSGQLPVEWEVKTLGNLCDFVRGPFGGSLKKSCFKDFGYAVYEQQHAIYNQFDDIRYFIDEAKYLEMKRFELFPRDLIMSCSGTMGKVAIVPEGIPKGIINQALLKLSPKKSILTEFLRYWMNSPNFQNQLVKLSQGVAIKNVASVKVLKEIQIYLPPLAEQKRIVTILDEAFEGCDRVIRNTEKNLANAREIFESYLNDIFTQKGDQWVEKKLDEIAGKVFTGSFGSLLHKSDYISDGIPIVNPANIEGDKIIPNFNKTISQDVAIRMSAYILKHNDVVVGRRGEIGRCAVVREDQAGWLCGSGSFFIKPFMNVNSIFLAHLLRSFPYRSKLEKLASGATMLNLSNQSLSELILTMPSLDEQNQIT